MLSLRKNLCIRKNLSNGFGSQLERILESTILSNQWKIVWLRIPGFWALLHLPGRLEGLSVGHYAQAQAQAQVHEGLPYHERNNDLTP